MIAETNTKIIETYFNLVSELAGYDIEKAYSLLMTSGLDTASKGFWVWEIEHNTEIYSPMFRACLGYEDKEDFPNIPESWMNAIFPEDLLVARENLSKHIETKGEYPYYQIVRYNKKHKGTVSFICQGKIVKWSDEGEPLLMIGVHMPVDNLFIHK